MNSPRFRQVDASIIADHTHLTLEDNCLFLFEYTSGKNYTFSDTNSLISNLKKKPSMAAQPSYLYKTIAIATSATHLRNALNVEWLKTATLVPVPSSKHRTDPEYDDRVTQICRSIVVPFPLDVREIVAQRTSIRAAHESWDRPTFGTKR